MMTPEEIERQKERKRDYNYAQYAWKLRTRRFDSVRTACSFGDGTTVKTSVEIFCAGCDEKLIIGQKYWNHRHYDNVSPRIRLCAECGGILL